MLYHPSVVMDDDDVLVLYKSMLMQMMTMSFQLPVVDDDIDDKKNFR
jgi:hypothetical protein